MARNLSHAGLEERLQKIVNPCECVIAIRNVGLWLKDENISGSRETLNENQTNKVLLMHFYL